MEDLDCPVSVGSALALGPDTEVSADLDDIAAFLKDVGDFVECALRYCATGRSPGGLALPLGSGNVTESRKNLRL